MHTALMCEFREKLLDEEMLLETELAGVGKQSLNDPSDWEPSQHELSTDTAEIEVRAS